MYYFKFKLIVSKKLVLESLESFEKAKDKKIKMELFKILRRGKLHTPIKRYNEIQNFEVLNTQNFQFILNNQLHSVRN